MKKIKTLLWTASNKFRRKAPRKLCPKMMEIQRLRTVLHDIANSRPDDHLNIEETPELTSWICDTCTKARVEAYPHINITRRNTIND